MQKYKNLADHIALAEFAHRKQTDKAGFAYIEHPHRVLAKVQAQGAMPFVQSAAILHDVTEDTAFTPAILLEIGVPEPVVELVKLLDRNYSLELWRAYKATDGEHESFPDPETFYYDAIRNKPDALMVKLADIEDNMSRWRLSYFSDETRERLISKYAKARRILQPGVWTTATPEFPNRKP